MLAVAIGVFVYTLSSSDEPSVIYTETENGTPGINPGGGAVPSGPPSVPIPSEPPPSN